jgi:hypothetical protein
MKFSVKNVDDQVRDVDDQSGILMIVRDVDDPSGR